MVVVVVEEGEEGEGEEEEALTAGLLAPNPPACHQQPVVADDKGFRERECC